MMSMHVPNYSLSSACMHGTVERSTYIPTLALVKKKKKNATLASKETITSDSEQHTHAAS